MLNLLGKVPAKYSKHWLACLAVIITLCLAVVSIASPRLIPYNMDEFIAYQTIGCMKRPGNNPDIVEKVATESCYKDNLRFPKTATWLPLRTYNYIGSISGLFYAPFYALFKSPVSVRIQGIVFFLVSCWLMSRLLRIHLGYILLGAVLFAPFVFSFLVDTGPIGLSTILLMSTLLLIRRAFTLKVQKSRDKYMALAGFLCFLGFWIKPSFVWWMPVVGLYILYQIIDLKKSIRSQIWEVVRQAAVFIATFGACSLVLLLTIDRADRFYVEYLQFLQLRVHNLAELVINVKKMIPLIFTGNHVSSVAAEVVTRLRDFIPTVLFGGLVWWWSLKRDYDRRIVLLFGSALATFVFAAASFGIATHHAALITLFLVMAVALILPKLPKVYLAVGIVIMGLFWGNLLTRINNSRVFIGTAESKDKLLAEVHAKYRDPDTAFVNVSWGTSMINNMFAAGGQEVWYYNVEIRPEIDTNQLANLLTNIDHGDIKKLVFIVSDPNKTRIREKFDPQYGLPIDTVEKEYWAAYTYALPGEGVAYK